jgi:UDP-N-acetylmuramoyl-tripeptide--D-alanyl-D-alanine ligase
VSTAAFTWTDAQVRRALRIASVGGSALTFTGVTTDSRKVRKGDLYVALVGERFDGHDFVAAALAAGASGAVVSRSAAVTDVPLYEVPDTLVALGRLARHRRDAMRVPIVGITGSSGKTSTKDFTKGALGAALRVHATTGNLNNRIGVPLTLLAVPAGADVVVVEMGTNEPGEIRTLAQITRPTIGMLTTVGESHLEKLGSVEGVLEEKLDLVRALPADGTAVVGDTPALLPERARAAHARTRVAGWTERADQDLRPVDVHVDAQGGHRFSWRGAPVALAVPGRHMVANALLALAVAETLGVAPAAAAAGVSSVQPGWMRGQVERVGGLTLLLDCYNANPQSTRASLEMLELQRGGGRVAVLGSMLELGALSDGLHEDVLRHALARDLDVVVATGKFARAARAVGAHAARPALVILEDPVAEYARLRELLEGDEVVLLKASRGVALEALLPLIRGDFAPAGSAPGDAPAAGGHH